MSADVFTARVFFHNAKTREPPDLLTFVFGTTTNTVGNEERFSQSARNVSAIPCPGLQHLIQILTLSQSLTVWLLQDVGRGLCCAMYRLACRPDTIRDLKSDTVEAVSDYTTGGWAGC